jgi:hypothetical protein
MARRATAGQMKLLLVRHILSIIATVLQRTGTKGYLLKGAIVPAHPNPLARTKYPGDIDLLVPENAIGEVHRGLIEEGFTLEEKPKFAGYHHHLESIYYRGIALELHRSITLKHFGVPDQLLIEGANSLDGYLHTLSPEATFFHVAAHSMWHQCLYGMKAAWLGDWILRWYPDFDWNRLGEIVDRTPTSRAFWAPLTLWKETLGMAIPDSFYSRRPCDEIQKRMNRIADRHGLSSVGDAGDYEPYLLAATYLMSCSDASHLGPVLITSARRAWGETRKRALSTLKEMRTDPSPAGWKRCAKKRIREMRESYRSFVKS